MNDLPLDEPRYTRTLAAQLADISLEFLERCETESLVEVHIVSSDQPGYSVRDIRRLTLIRNLHEDLELDFPALEVVLNMRRQLLGLQQQLEAMEHQAIEREERLRRELINLRRRLSDDAEWA
jgi:DNA-binding transcriptional MerR regulator